MTAIRKPNLNAFRLIVLVRAYGRAHGIGLLGIGVDTCHGLIVISAIDTARRSDELVTPSMPTAVLGTATQRPGPGAVATALLSRARCCELGASAVEFALLVPFLLLLITGIVELTNVYFVRSQMTEVARDAARRVATGAFSEDEAVKFVSKKLAETTDAPPKVEVTETELGKNDGVDISVSLSVPLKDVVMFDLIGTGTDRLSDHPATLSASATMLKQ